MPDRIGRNEPAIDVHAVDLGVGRQHLEDAPHRLDRGRVEFTTDDIGTIYFEWDKIDTITSVNQFEVIAADGRRFLGSLGAQPSRTLQISSGTSQAVIPMAEVSTIRPIGAGFWKKLDGSLDLGFSYTKSSDIAQLNLNTSTIYRRPSFEGRLTGSATPTRTEDEEDDDRGILQLALFRWRRWL